MGMYGGKTSKINTLSALQNREGFKQSIVLCDFKPGTRNITLKVGTYRVTVVGGGGGSSATPGNAAGGTSSFGTGPLLSATGGAARSAGGVGSGGDVNTSGTSTALAPLATGGGASGHRLGSAPDRTASNNEIGGVGWSELSFGVYGGIGAVDGFGLGIPPGATQTVLPDRYMMIVEGNRPYGCGGSWAKTDTVLTGIFPGLGGGGSGAGPGVAVQQDFAQPGGIGGGGAGAITTVYPGSGGGYSEEILTVTADTAYSYTVGNGGSGSQNGGVGCVIIERLA